MTGHFQHSIHSIDSGYNGRPLHGERLEASTRPTASPITLHTCRWPWAALALHISSALTRGPRNDSSPVNEGEVYF